MASQNLYPLKSRILHLWYVRITTDQPLKLYAWVDRKGRKKQLEWYGVFEKRFQDPYFYQYISVKSFSASIKKWGEEKVEGY